jgi:two-component system, OmpR family, sensor histidine kinase CpxA
MKLRVPLYGRVLAWSGLNVVFLVLLLWVVAGASLPTESLLSGLSGERVQRIADVLVGDLGTRPRSEWDEAIQRASVVYGVEFMLMSDREERLAGARLDLPESVRERLRMGPGGRRGGPPPDWEFRPGRPDGPGDGDHGPGRGLGNGMGGVRLPPPDRPLPRAILRAGDPLAYWAVIHTPSLGREGSRPMFARLIVRSERLGAGGVFFDPWPWWIAGVAVVFFSALWWAPFVGSITRAIRQMTAATEQVAQGRFDVTVAEERGDELGRMGEAINGMAKRLEGHVQGQKRFLGDIAHELCSPLARMEMALGVLEQRTDPRSRDYVEDVREEVRHMSVLVNELLSFSKAGLHSRTAPLAPVGIREVLERVRIREASEEDPVEVEGSNELMAMAEPDLLARALGNLLRNALRYASGAGPIRMAASLEGAEVVIRVLDEGPGVPPESLARLTEPFFRPDAARTREQGGAGLGLAIVRSCVEACRGRLTLRNRSPKGFEAEIRLAASGGPSPATTT